MLRWQRKSKLRRHKLWAKLIACSFGMHFVLLMLLFIGYQDNIKLVLSMSKQAVPRKSAPVTLFAYTPPNNTKKRTARRSVIQRAVPRKRIAKKPVTKVAKAPINKKQKPAIQKRTQKTAKKVTPQKKVAQAKPKPKPQPKKVAQVKPKPQQKKLAKNTMQQHNQAMNKEQATQQGPIQFDAGNVDPHMMQEFAKLQQELVKHWQPPVGIDSHYTCEITAQINRQGKIDDIVIDDSSGVLMFDVAARTAMLAMELPKWTWGKSLTITFKP